MRWLELFPTRLLTSEDEYKWFWHQMIYFPGTINIVSTWLYCHIIYINNRFTSHLPAMHTTYSVHAGIPKLWRGRLPCPLIVFSSHYVSRLSSSFVRSQLTLLILTMGIRLPPPQDGAPIRRVRTHSLIRVRDRNSCTFAWLGLGQGQDEKNLWCWCKFNCCSSSLIQVIIFAPKLSGFLLSDIFASPG
jgi:hypothetical protein